ncbi:HNH endonuclease [Halobacterium sp. KA-4]|nr:NUMOD3 domain-containing DNA-binding protein [Halobacterium sp. KA-4]MCD2201420.1 HNH endonuclease [Halobacterium sp. KA-4]
MYKHNIKRRNVEGENHGLYGQERSKSTKQRISESLEGRDLPDETRERIAEVQRGQTLPEETRARISESLTGRKKSRTTRSRMSEASSGEQNSNWKGGYSRRYGAGWTLARERALERDEVCQYCNEDGTETRLDVHHIVPVRAFRQAENQDLEDAHELDNLVVLCKRCHALVEHGSIAVPEP